MSPSEATNDHTRGEWRELGFYYAIDDSTRTWRLVGSPAGLTQFVTLLDEYVRDPRNDALSEHDHYGPYMYLKVMTWDSAGINENSIHGTIADIARLRDLVSERLSSCHPGQQFDLGPDYAPDAEYGLRFEIRAEPFDPAEADPELARSAV